MQELQRLADYIHIALPASWEACYETAMARYDRDWLKKLDFDAILAWYDFPQEYYPQRLQQELAALEEDETLNRICWLIHYILVYAPGEDMMDIWKWGKQPYLHHGSPMVNVVALLAGQPVHSNTIERCGYDAWQAEHSRRSVRGVWIGQHEDRGIDGVSFNLMVWGAYYLHGNLVRLGRLNYEYGLKTKHEYADRFGEDAAYIYLHIPPANNGLQEDEVEESVRMAQEKLEVYFPACAGKKKVFCVRTWLLGPQLKEMLKPTSNILKFQKRFHITHFYDGRASYVNAAFKTTAPLDTIDVSALPEDTGLQRAVKERLLKGLPMENGVGYFTLDDE